MSHELYYTSAARGLNPGARGYCIVAMTKGLPGFLAERLEDLSGYKPLFNALDPRNPVNYSHVRLELGQQTYHVLSRIASAGLDYSNRNNKFAHHVVLTPEELPPGGPAWLLAQPGFMESAWDQGEPRWLPAGRKPPRGDMAIRPCRWWQKHAGDAGWAGILAETALGPNRRPTVVLYDAGTDLLALFAEALALLPPAERWQVSFSTYAASVAVGEGCLWRGLVKNSAEAKDRGQVQGALLLTLGSLGAPAPGPLVESARTGKMAKFPFPRPAAPAGRKQPAAPDNAGADSLTPQVSLASLAAAGKSRPAPTALADEQEFAQSSPWALVKGLGMGLALAAVLIFGGELFSGGALADLGGRATRTQLQQQLDGKDIDLANSAKELKDKDTELTRAAENNRGLVVQIQHLKAAQTGNEKARADALAKLQTELDQHKERLNKLEATLAELQTLVKKLTDKPTPAVAEVKELLFKKNIKKDTKVDLLPKLPGQGKHVLIIPESDFIKDKKMNTFDFQEMDPKKPNKNITLGTLTFDLSDGKWTFKFKGDHYAKTVKILEKADILLKDEKKQEFKYKAKLEE